ncbi:ABC transporter ATP-binding protein [Chelatococcus asaccharovorans]|uniref:Spermidine/putrescine import ATP-binding protein PotA n=1 Tax=Chelatococcus asaccharovorans TaxID=28210 RepID=A0A2V3TYR7_9HYPH|nr:ABC transporter ATP-binding protein [Chelatococcus asaccharovorans]MBS7706751.1 ABC transporter ATP-binding protein [Chelatococcus asaccharovorans]PXW54105.1 putative spermidine/putrescine transport system ATP-binding protein [Chelatococcus asaccharovorans]
MPQGASLSLRDLEKYYDGSGAVLGVSLDLEPGKFLTLLGPSGSGKTTTLMMIAGFVDPTAGEILVNGRSVTRVPAHKRDMGMVFQSYALFPHMTVRENVGFPLRMRGVARSEAEDRIATFVKLVGLEALAKRYPQQLSGGQQQRVALARAMVFSPSLVLMDEPLGALDRRLRLQMQEEIKGIQRELGLTVIYVTHDQEEALTMSDVVAVMDGGRISSYGSPRDIYERPQNRFVANFIGESNFIPCRLGDQGEARRCELISGHSVAIAPTDAPAGSSAVIFLRPERLRLCKADDPLPNKVPGRITGEIYLGDSSLYRVRIAEGVEVKVKRPNRGIGMPIVEGDELMVGWKTTDSVILQT